MVEKANEKELENVDGGFSDAEYLSAKTLIKTKLQLGTIPCKNCWRKKPNSLTLNGGRCNKNGLSLECSLCNKSEFYTWKDLGVKEY